MKVKQFAYLSPEAKKLRHRDGIPPWGVHPCECDHFAGWSEKVANPFTQSLQAARKLRQEIEAV